MHLHESRRARPASDIIFRGNYVLRTRVFRPLYIFSRNNADTGGDSVWEL